MKKISIIDYKVGNTKSIANAINSFNANASLTSCHEEILESDAVVLPGVGSFAYGAKNLKKLGLDNIIYQFCDSKRPIMGICLGMQLLMDEGNEFEKVKGLGLVSGTVEKMKCNSGFSVPHIGWEQVKYESGEADFFFCHSYIALPNNPSDIWAVSNYGGHDFCAAIKKENITGYQFHPEKSGINGLKLIEKFVTSIGGMDSDE